MFPEGICVASMPQALNCGSLGNLPCESGDCYAGLFVTCALALVPDMHANA